jgi:hypothetical protein
VFSSRYANTGNTAHLAGVAFIIAGVRDRRRQVRIVQVARHPLLPLSCAAVFLLAGALVVHGCFDAYSRAATDDPVAIADRALDTRFNQEIAEREISAALAVDDNELAQSFVELAADRAVGFDPALADRVKAAQVKDASLIHTAGRFVQGLWTGEPVDIASFAGTAVGDLFVFGDIRDAAREGTRYLTGQKVDPWIFALAGAGLAITAGTYATLGAGAPARGSLTLFKVARRTGRLNPALVTRVAREAVKMEDAGGLADLVGNVGRVESKAGGGAALDTLKVAEGPEDLSRFARLASAKGAKTRAIIKLLGRGAILITASAIELATWLLWAACLVLGFASSCKAAAERMTLHYIRWRKARHAACQRA